MSVYYDIKEHLIIEDTEKYSVELDNIHYRLSLMAAWTLQHRGNVVALTLIADGKTFSFGNDILNSKFQEALDALDQASSVEIISDISFSSRAQETDPSPFGLMEYLDEEIKEDPGYLDGLFYCVYNNADCGNGAGTVCAYGKRNGLLYTGVVPFAEVDKIPDGDWYAPQTTIACEVDAEEGRDLAAIADVCRQLCRFSPETLTKGDEDACDRLKEDYGIASGQLDISEDSVFFYTNYLRIRNDNELKEVMQLVAKLIDLTDGECSLIGELVDISGPDAKILHFDVDANGEYKLKIAV